MIEIELRGILSKAEREKLIKYLCVRCEERKHFRRLLLDYSTFIESHGVVGRETDIRVRITNNVGEIILKKGAFGGASRSEKSLTFSGEQFLDAVALMAEMGYRKAMACVREIERFKDATFEYSIVTIPKYGYFFEIECTAKNKMDSKKREREISELCNQLGLQVFSTQRREFEYYVEKLNKDAKFANWVFEYKKSIQKLKNCYSWVQSTDK